MPFFSVWLLTHYKVHGRVFLPPSASAPDGGLFCEVDPGIWGAGNVRLASGKQKAM